jgi:hypothetical protein
MTVPSILVIPRLIVGLNGIPGDMMLPADTAGPN